MHIKSFTFFLCLYKFKPFSQDLNVLKNYFIIGEDFILWLTQHRNMSEEEAQYLATLICHYGYIFPVTDIKCLNVKNDNSFYRFQVIFTRC